MSMGFGSNYSSRLCVYIRCSVYSLGWVAVGVVRFHVLLRVNESKSILINIVCSSSYSLTCRYFNYNYLPTETASNNRRP